MPPKSSVHRIDTIHLYPELDRELVTLLRSLTIEQWQWPTLAPRWSVKDVAAHLLDGFVRTLSGSRDGHYQGFISPSSYSELVELLDAQNAEWVTAMRRVSPALLIEWIQVCASASTDHLSRLDMGAPAPFGVAWAGQDRSPNWFHIAREYTERWHHQQQIRHAVGDEHVLLQSHLYRPFLETCLQALPHHFRGIRPRGEGQIRIDVSDVGSWDLTYDGEAWQLVAASGGAANEVALPKVLAWRLFMNGLSEKEARKGIAFRGDEDLLNHFLSVRSVMV